MPKEIKAPTTTPDAETLSFEATALRRVTGDVSGALTELIRSILATLSLIPEGAGDVLTDSQARTVGEAVALRLRQFEAEPMLPALRDAAREAHALGVARSAREFRDPARRAAAAATKTPRRRPVHNVDKTLRDGLREAEKLARQGIRTHTDANAVAAKVSGTKARIEGTARAVANEGINAGTHDVAKKMGLRLLWVPERNACLDCLAHAGHVIEPGKFFPPVSFDPKARNVATVGFPPLHPNCRCQAKLTDEPAGPPPKDRSAPTPAARLAAEARRSVVYQWTDYESNAAITRAASALLSAGAGLPASVETRARRLLKARKK